MLVSFRLVRSNAAVVALIVMLAVAARLGIAADEVVVWKLEQLGSIGGQPTSVEGSPKLIDALGGKVVQFDGEDDGLFVDVNLLAGLSQFTAEVVFRPAAEGAKEQRFVHLQEDGSENRLLFEIRLTDDNRWYLDTFIKSGAGNYTLLAREHPHPIGPWYHAAVVVDGRTMRHFVNGKEELSMPIEFVPQKQGRSSFGCRINKVSWYKGEIGQLRITPRALSPQQFSDVR
jgi:hypothetical protein